MTLFLAFIVVTSQPAPADPVSFRAEVAPILAKRCLACHNATKARGGLDLSTFARLKKGGKGRGSAILVPGDPESSGLIESVALDAEPRMPLELPPLRGAEIAVLSRWVREGAKFDGPSEADSPLTSLVDPLAGLPELAPKVRSTDPIAAVAFSRDGSTLAAASGPRIWLFAIGSDAPPTSLEGNSGSMNAVFFSPDGLTIYAGGGRPGQFGSLSAWDVASKARKYEVRGHSDSILGAALSPDGKTIVTGSYDRLAKLWDATTGRELRALKEHTDAVLAVAFSPDGRSVASASADRTVKVWDVAAGQKTASLGDSTAEVSAVAFGPEGLVLAGGVDRSIRSWLLVGTSGRLVRSAFAHDAPIVRLAVSPDGKTLISGGEDRAVKRWDLASLAPSSLLQTGSDWSMALAIAPDGAKIAVGRADGSLDLLDLASGKLLRTLKAPPDAKPAEPPRLTSNATLNPPNPRGGIIGSTVRVRLSGNGVGRADAVVLDGADASAKIVPTPKPDPNSLEIDLKIGPEARPGIRRITVRTPLGTPASQPFAISREPEQAEAEPNDDFQKATSVALPATLLGTIDRPGDVDWFRFDAKRGADLVFEVTARRLGSTLTGSIAVVSESGAVLAVAGHSDLSPDPVLKVRIPEDGRYALRVEDADLGGSGALFYRIRAGAVPRVEAVFPLGFEPLAGEEVALIGVNLGTSRLAVAATGRDRPEVRPILDLASSDVGPSSLAVVLAEGKQAVEAEPNDDPKTATPLDAPGGASGRIDRAGDADLFTFHARKGQKRVIEVFGRRLGSPIDPALEVLDASGRRVPRAVLRPVEETNVAFRDHPSASRTIRLTQWNGFREGDFVLIGRELLRIDELPRNPDDDAVFWGTGRPRSGAGERIGFLGTTPEHHPMNQRIDKVEIHPPGSTFPPGGTPPVTLFYRNDDGGPGLGKDCSMIFDPPADGDYRIRVEDVRGLGGPGFGYHLVVREPQPDFSLTVASPDPNVPRGGTLPVLVEARRFDGHEGPIEVSAEGLPPGVSAEPSVIESESYFTFLGLRADPAAPGVSPPGWKVTGRSRIADRVVVHVTDPGGENAGFLSVIENANLKVSAQARSVTIRPGETVELTLSVERGPAFSGRVPIEVRNLPRGVKVLNIGLNGVLVTEKEVERTITLGADPWAEPGERPIFAVATCEPSGTEHSSAPIRLIVAPGRESAGTKGRGAAATP